MHRYIVYMLVFFSAVINKEDLLWVFVKGSWRWCSVLHQFWGSVCLLAESCTLLQRGAVCLTSEEFSGFLTGVQQPAQQPIRGHTAGSDSNPSGEGSPWPRGTARGWTGSAQTSRGSPSQSRCQAESFPASTGAVQHLQSNQQGESSDHVWVLMWSGPWC